MEAGPEGYYFTGIEDRTAFNHMVVKFDFQKIGQIHTCRRACTYALTL